jgi:hypothetical protein
MQLELQIFKNTPTKGEIVCRRISNFILESEKKKDVRIGEIGEIMSIKEIIKQYGL